MLDQVQRIQIRRIERDTFEADELIKRCLALLYRRRGCGRSPGGGSSSGSDGGGAGRGGGGVARRRGSVVSRPGSIKHSTRRSSATGGRFREVEQREVIRNRQHSDARARTGEASNLDDGGEVLSLGMNTRWSSQGGYVSMSRMEDDKIE